MLKSDLLVGEGDVTDLVDDFLGASQSDLLVELDLLSEVLLDEVNLNRTSLVWVQLIQDLFDFFVLEVHMGRVRVDVHEELAESLTRAEGAHVAGLGSRSL